MQTQHNKLSNLPAENVDVAFMQCENGTVMSLYVWETSLPKTEEEIEEAIACTGLAVKGLPVIYQIFLQDRETPSFTGAFNP